ncbi:MAG: 4Fe-4S dicluster domain-containing protein, partial [Planctomycetes bacterium]|nr:4Fe-4S dicluster domain-containing protein [Planctomycetota bacterium]
LAAAVSGTMVWEWVNPVTLTQRALIFGGTLPWLVVAAVFLYDLVVAPRGWCGYVCPMGACYNLIGKAAVVRVATPRRAACDDCMDCFAVCPEPQVIRPALKGSGTAVITASDCTNCGRCIDVCGKSVFGFSHRFTQGIQRNDNRREAS